MKVEPRQYRSQIHFPAPEQALLAPYFERSVGAFIESFCTPRWSVEKVNGDCMQFMRITCYYRDKDEADHCDNLLEGHFHLLRKTPMVLIERAAQLTRRTRRPERQYAPAVPSKQLMVGKRFNATVSGYSF
jgi:hypothetical protein